MQRLLSAIKYCAGCVHHTLPGTGYGDQRYSILSLHSVGKVDSVWSLASGLGP
jgi:hypothetical protein